MTPAEPWVAPHAVGQQQADDPKGASTPAGWFQNLQTQSVPAEYLHLKRPENQWIGARAATEDPGEAKEWTPRTPPPLIVSIIGQLLKLFPDTPQPTSIGTSDSNARRGESLSTGSFSNSVLPTGPRESLMSFPNSNVSAQLTPPSPSAPGTAPQEYTHTALQRIHPPPVAGIPAVLRICYAEYPSVFIVQSRDFQPYLQVRKSSQPAVHIYCTFPPHIDDRFDSVAKQHHFQPFGLLPGESSHNEQAEEEGLINPYIRQKQPTIFFHYDGQKTCHSMSGDGQPSQPRICIDTTCLWWPSIQCTFADPSKTQQTSGFFSWLNNPAEEIACGISISGPIKPLSMDLPY